MIAMASCRKADINKKMYDFVDLILVAFYIFRDLISRVKDTIYVWQIGYT